MVESWSLIFRYIFTGLGGLILLLVILWYLRDARRYHKVLKSLPDAGRIGELRCDATGKRYPLPREGYIGRSFSCDIRVRGQGIRNRHVEFIYRPGKGLLMRPVGDNTFSMAGQQLRGSAYALHGTHLEIGALPFTVLFFEGLDAETPEDLFDADADAWGPEAIPSYIPPERSYAPEGYGDPAAYDSDGSGIPEGWGQVPVRGAGPGYAYPAQGSARPEAAQTDDYGIPEDWAQTPVDPVGPVYPVQNEGDR